jgi:fatty acid desaturase
MPFPRILFLAPLFTSVIYIILYFDKSKIQNKIKIKNKIFNRLLFIITYVLIIIFFTIVLSIFAFMLMMGLIGLPVLFISDIIGIILLVRKIFISRKRNKNINYDIKNIE